MTTYPSTLPNRSHWFVPLVTVLTVVTSSCTPAATTRVAQIPAQRQPTTIQVPGIPNKPELVTVVPFYWKANEDDEEKTKVVIQAEISGHRGNFILDLGTFDGDVNRTFLRPNATGGIDTVLATDTTDPHRQHGRDSVHAMFHVGTLNVEPKNYTDSHFNATLDHAFGNFRVFAPRLGSIGLSILEQFETIIDYTHKRVILIRLDDAGHRLVDVPAYTPKWSAPLIDIYSVWGVRGLVDGVPDSLFFDTGAPFNALMQSTMKRVSGHTANGGALDPLVIAGRSFGPVLFTNDEEPPVDVFGFPFLSSLGVVGFNHRTHQFILYR